MKRLLTTIIILIFIISGCSYQSESDTNMTNSNLDEQGDINSLALKTLLIYDDSSDTYLNIFNQLDQSLVANLKIDKISVNDFSLLEEIHSYDIVYLDPKIRDKLDESDKFWLMFYVNNGGYLILENGFANIFPEELTGFTEPTLLKYFSPYNVVYQNAGEDISESQNIFRDYLLISDGFKKYERLEDFGYSVKPTTAEAIISYDDNALFTINQYGSGKVIYLNKMILNDELFNDSFSFESGDYVNDYYNYSFTSANMLMRNSLFSYISKDVYGFSLTKVLGTNGRPSMAWQNHFEVLHSIEDGAMSKWIDVTKDYRQIPSYSLIRIPFNWGKWHETITYYDNKNNNSFVGELADSAYSSGQNIYSGNELLMLGYYPSYNSYYTDIQDCFRACPDIEYLNDDNIPDLITGSSDGYIYLYYGENQELDWKVDKGQKIQQTNNNYLYTGGSSVPVLYDLDNDNDYDIVSGSESGRIYFYINNGDMKFSQLSVLDFTNQDISYSAPAIYDIDGDNIDDLIIGTSSGRIYCSKGLLNNDRLIEFSKDLVELEFNNIDTYTTPELWDEDNDGEVELLVGTNDGYVRVYEIEYPKIKYVKDIEGETKNRAGTNSIWGGHNSVPRVFDLDEDNDEELIVGQLQFSFGQPMNSGDFIYEAELRDELQYAKENYIDFYPHTYFHSYKSAELENEELKLHEKAFEYYGLNWNVGGTNQHTWRINEDNPRQSILSEFNNGIWWNSGYWYPSNPAQPSYDTQFVWTMPFMLTDGDERLNMILFSPISRYAYRDYYSFVGEYDMPLTYYYHIDEDVLYNGGIKIAGKIASELNDLREEYIYNFNTEYQMAKSYMALFNTDIIIKSDEEGIYTITKDSDDVDEAILPYLDSIGVKLEIGEKLNTGESSSEFKVAADMYYFDGDSTYFSLNEDEIVFKKVDKQTEDIQESHIVSANLPVDIKNNSGILEIEFLDHGIEELRIYNNESFTLISEGWELFENGDYVTIYKYGDHDTLRILLD